MSVNAPRILLVDDDPDQALIMQRWLAFGLRAKVRGCADWKPALEVLRREKFDIAIIDIELPSGSGLDLVARIRRHNTEMPILVVTAHTKFEYAVSALRAGASEFAVKPLQRNELVEKVRFLWDRSRKKKGPPTRVLAIGAHPDDVEIGAGGILLRHTDAGDEVTVLTLSSGEQGGINSVRATEARNAARLLGAHLELRTLPDTQISEGTATIDAISEVIKELKPEVVYTHTGNDVHQDHRNTHRASLVASRGVGNVFCYQSPSSTTAFLPTIYVDVQHVLQRKLGAIAAYESQTSKCAYLDPGLISATARYWSRFSNVDHVEPLEVVRCASYRLASNNERADAAAVLPADSLVPGSAAV